VHLKATKDGPRGRPRDVLASWVGLFIHHMTKAVRQRIAATADGDSANIAVFCVGFLQYGCAQAIGLRTTGLNVTLYYVLRDTEFSASKEDRILFLERARMAGVELVEVPRRQIRSLLTHTLWLHRDLRRRKIATAVVQSHIDPRYATLGLTLPVALILHDPQTHSGDEPSTVPLPVRLISRIAEVTSSCLIVHSALLFDQVRPLLRRLPIGDVPIGADMSPAPAPVPDERRLLLFGRLFAYKGVDTALDAFGSLPKELSETKLIVAGRGPCASLARGRRNVEVREEYIPDSDIDILLRDATLVLLPYKDATQSAVGVHAIERGIPCIVSNAGGLPDLLPESLPSLVVPPDNPRRLAEAIIAHVDHDEDLRKSIYDYAETHFAWTVVARRLRSELHRLVPS
jgi:glycosyltransferase involved in cell wall biosynthesis